MKKKLRLLLNTLSAMFVLIMMLFLCFYAELIADWLWYNGWYINW